MKSIIFLIMLSSFVNASYMSAKELYDKKNYRDAIREAKASTLEYSNPKLHLIWAKSAQSLGLVKESMSAYERVAILDEKNVESRLALIKIYKETKRSELSKELSGELQNYSLTPEQRSSLELLRSVDINSLKLKATLSIGHDTNVNISALADELDAYYSQSGNVGELSTLFTRVNASASYINELQERGGWYLRAGLKLYYQNNSDAALYNLFVAGVDAGVGYSGSGYSTETLVGLNKVNYLDTSLLNESKIVSKVNITLSQNIISNLYVKYAKRAYNDVKYKALGDSYYGLGAGVYYVLNKNYIYANSKYEMFSSDQENHPLFIDKKTLTFSLGANYSLSDWLVAKVDYKYRLGNYDDRKDLGDANSEKRADNYNQFELKLSHYFMSNYELFISDKYSTNSSNYVPADYKKNVAMFGISINY